MGLYRFGETVSIPYWTDEWRPSSWYDKIVANRRAGLHTLCLLDIKVKEQTIENLMRGRKIYEPPRFMSVKQALEQLSEVEAEKKENIATPSTVVIGLARLGRDDQTILSGPVQRMLEVDMGEPLHSLVIP